ncbi:uroporphyrinogen decarboxylase family protein [Candidatus Bathyarchaeota archaeon]|nr:uroporphyrinogen decarboxylase family protein [Candidatus Bathyarchaeota archaeon]
MLTHKERYMKAVDLESADKVPVDGTNLDLIHAQRILNREPMSTLLLSQKHNDTIDMNYVVKHNQRMINEASMRLDFDSLMVNDWHLYPEGFKPRFIDATSFVDHLGRIFRIKQDVKTTYWVDGIVKSPEDLEKLEFPEPEELNLDIVEETVAEAKEEYPVVGMCHSVVTAPFEIRGGIDKLIIDLYRQPDFAKRLIEKVFRYQIGIVRRFIEAGVDIITEGDDLADLKGPMFSPKMLREFFFPYIRKFIEECHSHKIPVMKHSDGNLYPILDDLIDLGIDGLHPIEPSVMDLRKVKQQYGDEIFLRGNVDCIHILPYGTEDDVRRDVRRCIDAAAKGGGFILSDSNSLHSNVKTENIQAMVDETRKYGKYH